MSISKNIISESFIGDNNTTIIELCNKIQDIDIELSVIKEFSIKENGELHGEDFDRYQDLLFERKELVSKKEELASKEEKDSSSDSKFEKFVSTISNYNSSKIESIMEKSKEKLSNLKAQKHSMKDPVGKKAIQSQIEYLKKCCIKCGEIIRIKKAAEKKIDKKK